MTNIYTAHSISDGETYTFANYDEFKQLSGKAFKFVHEQGDLGSLFRISNLQEHQFEEWFEVTDALMEEKAACLFFLIKQYGDFSIACKWINHCEVFRGTLQQYIAAFKTKHDYLFDGVPDSFLEFFDATDFVLQMLNCGHIKVFQYHGLTYITTYPCSDFKSYFGFGNA